MWQRLETAIRPCNLRLATSWKAESSTNCSLNIALGTAKSWDFMCAQYASPKILSNALSKTYHTISGCLILAFVRWISVKIRHSQPLMSILRPSLGLNIAQSPTMWRNSKNDSSWSYAPAPSLRTSPTLPWYLYSSVVFPVRIIPPFVFSDPR